MWNTVHGERYVPYAPAPGIPLRDVDPTFFRSFATNSVAPEVSMLAEWRPIKVLRFKLGLSYVNRKSLYVFHPDTLAQYPGTSGLKYEKVIVRRHRIELPLYIGAQFNQFYLDVGFRFVLKENLQLRKHAVADGNVITENYGAVNYGYLRYVPSATLGYRFHTNAGDVGALVAADWRTDKEFDNRWVDMRFGLSYSWNFKKRR